VAKTISVTVVNYTLRDPLCRILMNLRKRLWKLRKPALASAGVSFHPPAQQIRLAKRLDVMDNLTLDCSGLIGGAHAATLVFEVPLDRLSGNSSLEFTQQVWMLQPSSFEYILLDRAACGIVRMQWDRKPQ
jgi:hypothetical protein